MAIGGSSQNQNYHENRVFLKPDGLKPDSPETHLNIIEKVGNEYKTVDTCSWITGHLELFEKSTLTAKNQKVYPTLKIEIVDLDTPEKPTRYIINMFWGGSARELTNRLSRLTQSMTNGKIEEMVTIGVYNMEGERGRFSGMYLKYGNSHDIKQQAKVDKMWEYEKLKNRIKQVEVNGQKMNDYTELDKFFSQCIDKYVTPNIKKVTSEDWKDAFPKSEPATHEGNAIMPKTSDNPPPPSSMPDWMSHDDDDDLPF